MMQNQHVLRITYRKQNDPNLKAVIIPQDPCPASYVINEIMKLDGLAQKPQLCDMQTGKPIVEGQTIPKGSRLEYKLAM